MKRKKRLAGEDGCASVMAKIWKSEESTESRPPATDTGQGAENRRKNGEAERGEEADGVLGGCWKSDRAVVIDDRHKRSKPTADWEMLNEAG